MVGVADSASSSEFPRLDYRGGTKAIHFCEARSVVPVLPSLTSRPLASLKPPNNAQRGHLLRRRKQHPANHIYGFALYAN
jgi:hypothetical protein